MMRWFVRAALLVFCLAILPVKTPAPVVYRPGEGWSWEPIGGAKWVRTRAKDQLDVAQAAFDGKNYSLAERAARRTVKVWPFSDYAPQAQFLVARSYEERGKDQKAFKAYQQLLQKYPKIDNYDEVLQREFAIAEKYLGGKWFHFLVIFPYRSADKTAKLFEDVVKNGPYSSVAPTAQMNIGAAHEKGHDYVAAVKAYERAADRYHLQKTVAADALFKAGQAYLKQAKTAEYDQSIAGKAIATFTDFMTLYPDDPRVADAQTTISTLKTEQSRGNFSIAKYYEKKKRWDGALIYYNESVLKDPNSPYADQARQRIETIKARKVAQAASNK
jgi:outer membrane protein assembly factor BamD (BamD/ComL family)